MQRYGFQVRKFEADHGGGVAADPARPPLQRSGQTAQNPTVAPLPLGAIGVEVKRHLKANKRLLKPDQT